MKVTALAVVGLIITSFNLMAQNDELSLRQQSIVAIAANEAKGDLEALGESIDKGLDNGLSVNEVKEILSQLYAYTGFPRSLNALGTLQKVLAQREKDGKKSELGADATPLPEDFDALAAGTKVQSQLVGGEGWYQEWGKPAQRLKAGDVVDIPEGVKHWHGATSTNWFQHLTTHVATGGQVSNEWLEPVTDEQYPKD